MVLQKMSDTARDTNICFPSFKANGRELTGLPCPCKRLLYLKKMVLRQIKGDATQMIQPRR